MNIKFPYRREIKNDADLDKYLKRVCFTGLLFCVFIFFTLGVYYFGMDLKVYSWYLCILGFFNVICIVLVLLLDYKSIRKLILLFFVVLSIVHYPLVFVYFKYGVVSNLLWYILYIVIIAVFFGYKQVFLFTIYVLLLFCTMFLLEMKLDISFLWLLDIKKVNITTVNIVNIMMMLMVAAYFLLIFVRVHQYYLQRATNQNTCILKMEHLQNEIKKMNGLILQKNELINKLMDEDEDRGKLRFTVKNKMKNEAEIFEHSAFQNQYPEFLYKLQEKALPNKLTDLDLKYCMLIFLDYSNAEIMDTLFVATNTVRSQKQRLKKKLNLPNATDLNKFIKTLA
ncbi:hypothetical protein FACS189429_3680 [Bacteroidia bacterium]|nr:hypothetical protein FACS189429_3680 [Bacteroidia bacterium]GHV44514.1 hypothetical protein FACS1894180_5950 [Bacteroidia bacterium]